MSVFEPNGEEVLLTLAIVRYISMCSKHTYKLYIVIMS